MPVALGSAVTEFRRRVLVRMVATGNTGDGPLGDPPDDPLRGWADRGAVWEVFEDAADLLLALQLHWVDLIRHAVYASPHYPLGPDRVRELYAELGREHAPLRAILETRQDDADDDALVEAVEEERILLARAAGHLQRMSPTTLAHRGRDLLETVPAQRTG